MALKMVQMSGSLKLNPSTYLKNYYETFAYFLVHIKENDEYLAVGVGVRNDDNYRYSQGIPDPRYTVFMSLPLEEPVVTISGSDQTFEHDKPAKIIKFLDDSDSEGETYFLTKEYVALRAKLIKWCKANLK